MKLTKGKISKLYNKKQQTAKKIKKRKGSLKNKTFRRKRNINLANKFQYYFTFENCSRQLEALLSSAKIFPNNPTNGVYRPYELIYNYQNKIQDSYKSESVDNLLIKSNISKSLLIGDVWLGDMNE